MLPPAPARLSITIGWPSAAWSAFCSTRAARSVCPPGGKPTIRLTGRSGQAPGPRAAWARARPGVASPAPAASMALRRDRPGRWGPRMIMRCLLHAGGLRPLMHATSGYPPRDQHQAVLRGRIGRRRDRPAFRHPGAAVPRGGIGVTGRKREPQRDTDADNTAREAMFAAADDYRGRFGEAVGTWERELRAAIARGQPVTMEELYERTGVPPLDVE